MSRKVREIKKNFKVFCEGDTEYHYVDEMRRQLKLSITLKPVNMKGGGYSSFLDSLKTDSNTNCLAKFIIIDGDRAVSESGEKAKLRELVEYCILQNDSGRTPHVLIVNDPDFEYVGCLHTPEYRGQNTEQYITKIMGYKDMDDFKGDTKIYQVLNSNGNSSQLMMKRLKPEDCFVINHYTVSRSQFEIKIKTIYDWEKLGWKSSNIHEFFQLIHAF